MKLCKTVKTPKQQSQYLECYWFQYKVIRAYVPERNKIAEYATISPENPAYDLVSELL